MDIKMEEGEVRITYDFPEVSEQGEKTCDDCGASFSDSSDLVVHRFVYHGAPERQKTKDGSVGLIQCHDCDLVFDERNSLSSHRQEKHLFQCRDCKDSFPTSALLAQHTSEMGVHKAQFECTDCGSSFDDKIKLKIHRRRHQKNLQCDICLQFFSKSQALKSHKLVKHDASPQSFKCKICKKAFPYSTSLRYHMRTHGDKLIACEICGLKFHFAFNYKRHVELNHGRPEDKVVCEHCGGLYSKLKMRDHLARHGDPTIPCDLCGKMFRVKELMRRHKIKFHKEKLPHACPMCSRSFVKAENLVSHFSRKHKDTFGAVELPLHFDV